MNFVNWIVSKINIDLTQITFELYERSAEGGNSPNGRSTPKENELSLRIGFSQGAHDPNLIDLQIDSRHAVAVTPRKWITDHISLQDAIKALVPK